MAKTRTRKRRRDPYPRIHHVSAPRRLDPEIVEEFVGAPNGNVLILRVKRGTYGFLPELLTIDKRRSLPVSFGGGEPRNMREAIRMAKAWLDRFRMGGAN